LKSLFGWATDNVEGIPSNPWERIKLDGGKGEDRDDFTTEERRAILTAAREACPVIRWCNWLSAFHGFRNSEIADATTRDVECINGFWVIRIRTLHRSRDQRNKTEISTRTIALHSAVLAEGFIEYVKSLPEGPLFPQIDLDGYGKRSGKMTSLTSD
jgi:integrase